MLDKIIGGSSRFSYITALIAGALLPLALGPKHWAVFGFISPLLLLWLWHNTSTGKACLLGFNYGIGFWGVGISWVINSIYIFGGTPIYLAVLITSLLVISFSIFFVIHALIFKIFITKKMGLQILFGFPALWVLFEWIRGWLFTGFPWAYLGVTQLDTPLKNYAPIGSVYLVSLSVVLISSALFGVIKGNKTCKLFSLIIILLTFFGGIKLEREWTYSKDKAKTLTIIQGNLKPFDKHTLNDPLSSAWNTYGQHLEGNWTDLVLWPEGGITAFYDESHSLLNTLNQLALEKRSALVTGIFFEGPDNTHYNSVITLGFATRGYYHKRHLLPFGDYYPYAEYLKDLVHFFNLPMSNNTPGPSSQSLLKATNFTMAPFICYEIAFPQLVKDSLNQADVIINLSEDGWFGNSWGPYQHLDLARMRALETGRYVLRSTPTGISAIIKPNGKIDNFAALGSFSILKGQFYKMQGNTPWLLYGIGPFMTIITISLIISFNYALFKKNPT
ncbi:MAG: lnt [Francisellaceae bacterium]|nr:lnt [Francisellaceae bacterium]